MRGGGGAALVERAHKREGVTSRLWCLCVGGRDLVDVCPSVSG